MSDKELVKTVECGEVVVDIYREDNKLFLVGYPKDDSKKTTVRYEVPVGRIRHDGVEEVLLEFKAELDSHM